MIELIITCTKDEAEDLSDAAIELGALSVSVEDADKDTAEEQALFGEPGSEPEVLAWSKNNLIVLLPEEITSAEFLKALSQDTEKDWSSVSVERKVEDQDWVRLTQSQFDPIQIGKRIWIVPSWHQSNPDVLKADQDSNNILIGLDPGLAFGTGSHPTTMLCAEWIEAHLPAQSTVLDYGCGSGILAIIAAKCDAKQVVGVDIDSQAVEAAKYNAAENNSAIDFFLPDDLQAGQFDVVVANILSSPLKVLAPMLSARVAQQGFLVLSGVLERQALEVIEAYSPWIKLDVWQASGGWVCLVGQKG